MVRRNSRTLKVKVAWSVTNTLIQGWSADIVKDGFFFQCEGTAKKKVIQEYPEEMQCIFKKDKINQEDRVLESKCKTTITELEQLKDNTKK